VKNHSSSVHTEALSSSYSCTICFLHGANEEQRKTCSWSVSATIHRELRDGENWH